MSIFNPEMKEFSESGFEAAMFSPDTEKKLLQALQDGKESFPDLVQCPNHTCGNPLKITIQEHGIRVYCVNCGFERIVQKLPSSNH